MKLVGHQARQARAPVERARPLATEPTPSRCASRRRPRDARARERRDASCARRARRSRRRGRRSTTRMPTTMLAAPSIGHPPSQPSAAVRARAVRPAGRADRRSRRRCADARRRTRRRLRRARDRARRDRRGHGSLEQTRGAHRGAARAARSTPRRRIPCRARAIRTRTSCASAKRRARRKTRPAARSSAQAGQLLTKILEAINLSREEVFICNVLKHRPPGNRNPLPEEVTACSPYLVRQIELVDPKVILALGTFAAQTLLETKLSIGKLRGQVHRYHGVPADRHLSSRRAAPQSGVEAPYLGRCPARPSNTR